nr:MAG TPA: hypothetical protein [Inoviridae sp.]
MTADPAKDLPAGLRRRNFRTVDIEIVVRFPIVPFPALDPPRTRASISGSPRSAAHSASKYIRIPPFCLDASIIHNPFQKASGNLDSIKVAKLIQKNTGNPRFLSLH